MLMVPPPATKALEGRKMTYLLFLHEMDYLSFLAERMNLLILRNPLASFLTNIGA